MAVIARVLMEGADLQHLRKSKGWNQENLADKSGVGVTTIKAVENERSAVLGYNVVAIADALGVSLDSLVKQFIYPDGLASLMLPDMSRKMQDKLNRACDCDVIGNYQEAIAICDKLLLTAGRNGWEDKALIGRRRASFQDNMGKHEEAFRFLDQLIATAGPQNGVGVQLLHWAQYHKAIALRRLGKLAEAERELRELLTSPPWEHRYAAIHQLGVVCLEHAKGEDDPNLTAAFKHFEEARTHWQNEHNHREGFALRRMGQAYARKGLWGEAIEHFFEAVVVLARCRCWRYGEETRREMRKFVLARL